MSIITPTFRPDCLAGVEIGLNGCDGDIGGPLAVALADFGATLRLEGADAVRLHDLQMSITGRWGRATVAGPDEAATSPVSMIRMFSNATLVRDTAAGSIGNAEYPPSRPTARVRIATAEQTRQALGADSDALPATEIWIVTDASHQECRGLEALLSEARRSRFVITLPERAVDRDALALLVALLLSSAGDLLPNQCVALQDRKAAPVRQEYPAVMACAPTIASSHTLN
ncbi:MAG: hypothetical protein J7499_03610 [Sphingopyxis sp.]|nr:hypothetical protein [Sphingopyxis sp.]